jgi:MFS family permease
MSCCQPGLFLSMICVFLSMNEFEIGMVNAIPNLALTGQLVAAMIHLRFGNRKKFFLVFNLIFRVSAFLIAGILLAKALGHGPEVLIGVFLVLFLVFHLFLSMQIPLWFSWMGDLLPDREVASFWGTRNTYVFIAGLVCSLLIGYALDLQESYPWMLALTFGIGAVLAMVELFLGYWKLPALEVFSPSTCSLVSIVRDAFCNANFKSLLAFTVLFNLGVFLMIPFFFLHLKDLGLSSLLIQVLGAIGALGAMVGSIFWSSLANIVSNKQALMLSILVKLMVWVLLMVINANTPIYLLYIFFVVDGFLNGGVVTSVFSMLTAETPKVNRSIFTALYFSFQGGASFLAASCSGIVFTHLKTLPLQILGHEFMPFHALFFINFITTPLALICLSFYRTERSSSTWHTMILCFEGTPFLSFLRLTHLAGRSSFKNRYHFIQSNRSRLFVPELIEAINDPSRLIREAAVKSLGYIKDDRSEEELIRLLDSDESGLRHLAAESLGRLRSEQALDHLLKYLNDEGPVVRRAVIFALAQIHSKKALDPLIHRLNEEDNVAVAAELADALSRFECVEVIDALFMRLKQVKELGLRRQFGVALANLMGESGEFYPLLSEESLKPGSVRSRLMKTIKKKHQHHDEWVEVLQEAFDDEQFEQVITICLRRAVMFMDLKLQIEKHKKLSFMGDGVAELGKNEAMDIARQSKDRRLWLLASMNSQEHQNVQFEEAMLAMYLLALVYKS